MFGKTTRHETVPTDTEAVGAKSREDAIIESIMRFTGASSIDELEEVVKSAESASGRDKASEEELLFGAVNTIKKDHSLMEAKEMEKNEDFVNAVLAGFSAEKAYMLVNGERLIEEAYLEGEKKGKLGAAVKKDRVGEEGMKVAGGYKAEIDPANMTMEDLKKIKERLRKGENVRI